MSLCPKTLQPCCDDICHGSGCLEMNGSAMVQKCEHCGHFFSEGYGGCDCKDAEDEEPDWEY